jgi:hypothetical protein
VTTAQWKYNMKSHFDRLYNVIANKAEAIENVYDRIMGIVPAEEPQDNAHGDGLQDAVRRLEQRPLDAEYEFIANIPMPGTIPPPGIYHKGDSNHLLILWPASKGPRKYIISTGAAMGKDVPLWMAETGWSYIPPSKINRDNNPLFSPGRL